MMSRASILWCERMSVLGKPVMRAAVYTRKSSDKGLNEEFNSMDAQYEGWELIKKRYDDGGISERTLKRPALLVFLAA